MDKNKDLCSELENAVRSNDVLRARDLVVIKGIVDPEANTYKSFPLLHICADAGYVEMSNFLINEAMVDLYARDEDGYTALEWAFKFANVSGGNSRILVARNIEDARRIRAEKPSNP